MYVEYSKHNVNIIFIRNTFCAGILSQIIFLPSKSITAATTTQTSLNFFLKRMKEWKNNMPKAHSEKWKVNEGGRKKLKKIFFMLLVKLHVLFTDEKQTNHYPSFKVLHGNFQNESCLLIQRNKRSHKI